MTMQNFDTEKIFKKNSSTEQNSLQGSHQASLTGTHSPRGGFLLWPENPSYQVYIPGYNPNLLRSTTASIQQQLQRTGSISPNTMNALMTTDNRVLYAELQFPVTSNFGSMKKRSQRDSVANTTASTSVHSGEPSPTGNIMMSMNEDQVDVGSLESVHQHQRYIPEYLAVSNRKTAV